LKLSEQEIQQICRAYEIKCAVCGTANSFYRLKRDMARAAKTDGDGHPISYKWGKPGFDSVDPKLFFMGTCANCGFTGELDETEYRTSGDDPSSYKRGFTESSLQQIKNASSAGKGITQSLLKRVADDEDLLSTIAKFHLAILAQCCHVRITPGNIARYYLRLSWLYRDQEMFYPESSVESIAASLAKVKGRWEKELPQHSDYPEPPAVVLSEAEALAQSRAYFERNYETLKEAKAEDELRLRYLLAEIDFRLYTLTDNADDHKRAATFFSGTMQQCLSILSDKSIVGGAVNRAREMLEKAGERGRELRALHKSRGGTEPAEDGADATPKAKAKKKKVKKNGSIAAAEQSPKEIATGKKTGTGKSSRKPDPEAAQKQPAPATSTAAEEGTTAQQDQEIRKLSVLVKEVGTLKDQIKDLEADNKKWRQLIGRDSLTGLPNKLTFFRINLPKELRALPESGPISCIAIGLDHVLKVNREHGWETGDRMLKESGRGLRRFLQDGDELYRLDGANFVLSGKMDSNAARQRAAEMRRTLSTANVRVGDLSFPLASSLGVVTVERTAGESDTEAGDAVYNALLSTLYRAKEKGGNTAEIHNSTRFYKN